jgi:hypothetical protein
MVKKALWYIEHQDTHIHKDGDKYYILRRDNPGKYVKIHSKLLECYELARQGAKDRRVRTFDYLKEICFCFHIVEPALEPWGVPQCEGNPAQLNCPTCKGFKGVGICSHVLAVNRMKTLFNVRHQLRSLAVKPKKGGYRKGVRPALIRERPSDSSDEEEDTVHFLGLAGR